MYGMLKDDVRRHAIKIASRLIIKVAKQIADTGYRSGKLKLVKGCNHGAEIDLDKSLERFMEEPEQGISECLMSLARQMERQAFVMIFDRSYSMKGIKIVLAAITAASIAQHFKKNFAILAFSNNVSVLKGINNQIGPEKILEQLFDLKLQGETDIHKALHTSLDHIRNFELKRGLILTDGAWNRGKNPLDMAGRFDKLSVIGFPPANLDKIKRLAFKGKGEFSFVQDETEVSAAILKSLN